MHTVVCSLTSVGIAGAPHWSTWFLSLSSSFAPSYSQTWLVIVVDPAYTSTFPSSFPLSVSPHTFSVSPRPGLSLWQIRLTIPFFYTILPHYLPFLSHSFPPRSDLPLWLVPPFTSPFHFTLFGLPSYRPDLSLWQVPPSLFPPPFSFLQARLVIVAGPAVFLLPPSLHYPFRVIVAGPAAHSPFYLEDHPS